MDLGAILLLIVLLLGVGFYLAAPLLGNRAGRPTQQSQAFSSLMAERDRVISALQELDFDFKLGKIPQGDYPTLRGDLLKNGAEILRKLDELSIVHIPRREPGDPESRLEKAAAGQPAHPGTTEGSLSDDEIESMLAARRKAHKSTPARFCPHCGKPILITDRFCPNCGKAVN
jgi:zinc-ribbon domain